MDRQDYIPMSDVDSEHYLNYISTAPTTPDGSLTFSPVLQAMRLHDALEDAGVRETTRKMAATSLSESATGTEMVKNICCIGAGYVGRQTPFYAESE